MRQAVSFVCVDLGFNFTQQNSKVDVLFNLGISYEVKSNRFALKVEDTFGRQDAVPDIERRELGIAYARELGKRWFLLFGTSARRNTQLNLDQAISVLGGPGRYVFASDRATLMAFIAPSYRRERYVDEKCAENRCHHWAHGNSGKRLHHLWGCVEMGF